MNARGSDQDAARSDAAAPSQLLIVARYVVLHVLVISLFSLLVALFFRYNAEFRPPAEWLGFAILGLMFCVFWLQAKSHPANFASHGAMVAGSVGVIGWIARLALSKGPVDPILVGASLMGSLIVPFVAMSLVRIGIRLVSKTRGVGA